MAANGIIDVLIAHPSLPARNVKELVAVARARPGEINYATGGTGSAQHIPMEMLMVATGTKLAHVPYKGLTPALNDIVGGQIPVMFAGMAGALPHIRANRVRVLAVSGGKRSGVLPEVPPVAESGIAGFDYSAWFGYVAPAGTPRDVVARLNADIAKSANHPDTVEKLVGLGFEMSTGTPEQFAAYIRSEMTRIGELVRRTGMRAE